MSANLVMFVMNNGLVVGIDGIIVATSTTRTRRSQLWLSLSTPGKHEVSGEVSDKISDKISDHVSDHVSDRMNDEVTLASLSQYDIGVGV